MKRMLLATALLAACKEDDGDEGPREALLDPASCEECHPKHYQQWLGSMHAYAGDDPVFLAMNAKGQRETGGALGNFCVQCHAPMAVALGETTDGLNLGELPQSRKGVTCYFCHNVASIDGAHNNPLRLAFDDLLRGEYDDAVENDFHRTDYSTLLDGETVASGDLCGSCHDIQNTNGVHLERTYKEWLDSFYSDPSAMNPQLVEYYGLSCNDCHMPGSNEPIADAPGVQTRSLRDHRFVGIDVALTDFPDAAQGPALVADQMEHLTPFLDPNVCVGLCVNPSSDGTGTDIELWLHNEFSGHNFPSGAAQDRRMWVELQAYDGEVIVLESGVVADGESVDAAAIEDPMLWLFRDFAYGANGEPVSMFWEVVDVESNVLTVAAEAGLKYDKTTWVSRTWHVDGPVDRATVGVKVRPIAYELVDELVADGLDPAVKDRIPTHVLAETLREWTPATAEMTDIEGSCVKSASCFDAISMDEGL